MPTSVYGLGAATVSQLSIGTGGPGAALTASSQIFTTTGIADNTSTPCLTVTVPNANMGAALRLTYLASLGGTDAYESSRVGMATATFARTTDATAVAGLATPITGSTTIATVSGGGTFTVGLAWSAASGLSTATQTFLLNLTMDNSGSTAGAQFMLLVDILNAVGEGVTVSA